MSTKPSPASLAPGTFVDSDHPSVIEFARSTTYGARTDQERASSLFAAVRDKIRYDPYSLTDDRAQYRASAILETEASWCVPKAVVLTAAARAAGIPALLGFSDVRNHLSSPKLRELMGTDLFVYHGWVQMFVAGQWKKASPAFNIELCARFGSEPLEFDGSADALLHEFDGSGRRHMEYVAERGVYEDLPFDEVMEALHTTYGGLLSAPDPGDSTFQPSKPN